MKERTRLQRSSGCSHKKFQCPNAVVEAHREEGLEHSLERRVDENRDPFVWQRYTSKPVWLTGKNIDKSYDLQELDETI